jgi:hypothetical protein
MLGNDDPSLAISTLAKPLALASRLRTELLGLSRAWVGLLTHLRRDDSPIRWPERLIAGGDGYPYIGDRGGQNRATFADLMTSGTLGLGLASLGST